MLTRKSYEKIMEENETGNAVHCKRQSSKKRYSRKRTFAGNQYSKNYVKKVI